MKDKLNLRGFLKRLWSDFSAAMVLTIAIAALLFAMDWCNLGSNVAPAWMEHATKCCVGGLSSLYMWLAMGIFPVSGQDLMIIGSPKMLKSVMHLASGNDFTIRREGEGIYVKQAVLNGVKLDKMSFAASEMMKGGELVLTMSETPCC